MKSVYVATKTRGFLSELFDSENSEIEFIYENKKMYETNSRKKMMLSKLIKSKLADQLGVIQRIKVNTNSSDIAFSYNRFLNSNVDYVIYLENPVALVHYSIDRSNTILGSLKLKKYFNDPHLKAIVCLSKACYETLGKYYDIPSRIKITQIYPLVNKNSLTSRGSIKEKCNDERVKCLYISSNFNLKGGREILAAFDKLKKIGLDNIKLQIVTKLESVSAGLMLNIQSNKNISLFDFRFNKEELSQLYNDSCILLNPTRQDSFSLVVLEAMKSGNVIISTDLYAIPEMVQHNDNGFLTSPKYRFFNYDNMPNKQVWNDRKNTIYLDFIDTSVVEFLTDKLIYLNSDRIALFNMALRSLERSDQHGFNEKYIIKEWLEILT
ncbi:glycosyltransferase family 4 protein [Cohnella fermenti]|uniref:Glycosyltransferase family 4 protein n=1 Tax=Cohnella fermenti TaxID=2565925 RepID=A0A4S4BZS6_9BACL|nr:glycosyltransferase family 4 protein [Cohnella fermenti]THF80836.1 glycosyltransferase family 4 protein [Cohnella fermenti]